MVAGPALPMTLPEIDPNRGNSKSTRCSPPARMPRLGEHTVHGIGPVVPVSVVIVYCPSRDVEPGDRGGDAVTERGDLRVGHVHRQLGERHVTGDRRTRPGEVDGVTGCSGGGVGDA